jgi:hypothetical protein
MLRKVVTLALITGAAAGPAFAAETAAETDVGTGGETAAVNPAVEEFVKSMAPQLKAVYEGYFGEMGAGAGSLRVTVVVSDKGLVTDVKIDDDLMGFDAFADAVREEIRGWQIPRDLWGSSWSYELMFDPMLDAFGCKPPRSFY